MEKLLKNKLEAVENLKNYTQKIMSLSLVTDFSKVNSMIDKRQKYMKEIDLIDIEINEYKKNTKKFKETTEIKNAKLEIKIIIKEIIEADKVIRKKISNELKSVKTNLNHPQTLTNRVNIKA